MKTSHLLALVVIGAMIGAYLIPDPAPLTATQDYSGFFCMTNGKAWTLQSAERERGMNLVRDRGHDKDCKP